MLKTLILFVAVVSGIMAYVLWNTGITTSITPRFGGTCSTDHSVPAAEDIIIDPIRGIAYLSSYNAATAGVYTLDLTSADSQTSPLPLQLPPDFLPLGISAFPSTGPFERLFVINRSTSPSIEVFALPGGQHLQTYRDPALRYPNNLVALDRDEFYATNTHDSEPSSWRRLLQTLLRLETGSIIHFKQGKAAIAAGGIGYANGIAASASGRQIYAGSISNHIIHRFDRAVDGTLSNRVRIATPGGVDNITITHDGHLLAALHPKAFAALSHLSGQREFAPSRVVEIEPDQLHIVYEDTGEQISAAAVAARWRDQLLIGPVKDDHFLRCNLNGADA